MKLTTPSRLKKGSTIYIISPSAGLLPFVVKRALRAKGNLEKLGYKVVFAPNSVKNSGYVSADIGDRVDDIHRAFSDPDCRMVMAAIGGNHSNQLISEVDYDLIRQNPKIFIGYSDNTVLHYALSSQAKLRTYYGPCYLNQFGEYPKPLSYTLRYFKEALEDNKKIEVLPSQKYTDEVLDWFQDKDMLRPRKLRESKGFIWWRQGSAKGLAIPGTIPSINHLLPTEFAPQFEGGILMIDLPEGNDIYTGISIADFDSWMTDLKNAGVLRKINGLIISRPYHYSLEQIDELKQVIMRLCSGFSFPILFNMDFGHTDPIVTIPIYSNLSIDSADNRVVLTP